MKGRGRKKLQDRNYEMIKFLALSQSYVMVLDVERGEWQKSSRLLTLRKGAEAL